MTAAIAEHTHATKHCRGLALALAAVLGASALASTLVYFFYPLEVECMEGSNWIEALAFRDGRNPYRDPGLAFINTNHGPLDAPVKAFIARALPWLDSWEVIRLPGLLLPLILVLALRVSAEKSTPLPWRWAGAAGFAAYFVIQSSGNMVANMGRSDALMLLLLTLLVPLGVRVFSAENRVRLSLAFAGGAVAAAAFLENFRTVLVLPAMALALAYDWPRDRFHPLPAQLRCLVAAIMGFAAVFVVVVGVVFHFDFQTYYRFSLGFFLSPHGHGLTGLPRWRDLTVPFLENKAFLLLPVVLLGAIAVQPRVRAGWLRAAVLGAPFAVFLAAYVANYVGAAGGLHYFAPVVILALLLWRLGDWNETLDGAQLLVLLALILFACNWRVVANNTLLLFHTRHDAAAFNEFVRDLDSHRSVESQDIHLFQTHLRPTEVDLGFLSELTQQPASAAYYGKFSQSFTTHEARMVCEPPDAIVVGDFPSRELAARLRAGDYRLVRESPPRIYNAENLTRTRIYVRRDLVGEFTEVKNPSPQFRQW